MHAAGVGLAEVGRARISVVAQAVVRNVLGAPLKRDAGVFGARDAVVAETSSRGLFWQPIFGSMQ